MITMESIDVAWDDKLSMDPTHPVAISMLWFLEKPVTS